MSFENLSSQPFAFDDPRQKRIFVRLQNLVGIGPAYFYRDACTLMASVAPLPSTTHLVAHLLREIESALRDVLETCVDPGVRESRQRSGGGRQHAETLLILSALDLNDNDVLRKAWFDLAGKENDRALCRRAHRDSLAPPRPVDKDFQVFWEQMEHILDTVLDAFEAKYLRIHQVLDERKALQNPVLKDAEFLKGHIPNNFVAFDHFFRDLDNPAWLEPLHQAGIFSYPPPPVSHPDDKSVSHPLWAQSSFLARMATRAPELVAGIALEIDTDNINIQSDLVDMVCALPSAEAVKFIGKLSGWLKQPTFFISHKLSPLITNLVRDGKAREALILSKELLGLDIERVQLTGADSHALTRVKPRIQAFEYEDFLRDTLPLLLRADPLPTLTMLLDLLSEVIDQDKADNSEDPSIRVLGWLPTIEPSSEDIHSSDIPSRLVIAARDAATYCFENAPGLGQQIFVQLDQRGWKIFVRLKLHLLWQFGDNHPTLVRKCLLDKKLFEDVLCYHEYILLASRYFSKLRINEKKTILGWLETDAKDKEYGEHWQLRRLTMIKDGLPKGWREHYEALLRKFGEPEHPDLVSWSSGVLSGPASPISEQQIQEMKIEELVTYLQEWKQPLGFTMESPEGISRTLTKAVSDNPIRYASSALLFAAVHPTYVRGLFSGFREAVKGGKEFDWSPVLQLMLFAAQQVVDTQQRDTGGEEDTDPSWAWTRMEICRLLETALNESKNPIKASLQELAWSIIELTTGDPDPTVSDETREKFDPATNSLNSVRGVAFHALIAYALWRKRHTIKQENARGFNLKDLPSVRDVLEAHLDSQVDASLTIRSIYGWRFPNLLWLDREWTLANKHRIFPLAETDAHLWGASWNAFVSFNNPDKRSFEDLLPEYQYAATLLSQPAAATGWGNDPSARLTEHLLILYAWGVLDISSPLMQTFWNTAYGSCRTHALHFIGRDAKNVPPSILARFQAVWEYRLAGIGKSAAAQCDPEEVKEFGWTFASGAFPDDWSLHELARILDSGYKVDDEHFVFERLAALSPTHPAQVVKVLGVLLTEPSQWSIIGARDSIRKVLETCIASNDTATSDNAKELINRLAAKGYAQFGDLVM